jgi:hypothetical protein
MTMRVIAFISALCVGTAAIAATEEEIARFITAAQQTGRKESKRLAEEITKLKAEAKRTQKNNGAAIKEAQRAIDAINRRGGYAIPRLEWPLARGQIGQLPSSRITVAKVLGPGQAVIAVNPTSSVKTGAGSAVKSSEPTATMLLLLADTSSFADGQVAVFDEPVEVRSPEWAGGQKLVTVRAIDIGSILPQLRRNEEPKRQRMQ